MAQNFNFGLISSANLMQTPQDSLKNAQSDFTSVFGNKQEDFLNEIYVHSGEENFDTPFSYDNVMKNVLVEDYQNQNVEYYEDEEDGTTGLLGFEC